jgi:hypothetical protein
LCRLKQGTKNFTELPDRVPKILILFCGITRESPNSHRDIELLNHGKGGSGRHPTPIAVVVEVETRGSVIGSVGVSTRANMT